MYFYDYEHNVILNNEIHVVILIKCSKTNVDHLIMLIVVFIIQMFNVSKELLISNLIIRILSCYVLTCSPDWWYLCIYMDQSQQQYLFIFLVNFSSRMICIHASFNNTILFKVNSNQVNLLCQFHIHCKILYISIQ